MKTITVSVNLVTVLVQPVLPLIAVLLVLVTEKLSVVLVLAQNTPMKTDNQHAQNVLKNVKSVLTCQTTVLFVLKEELTHQNVTYQTQLLNLLLLEISQLDPSKLLTVLADVKLVKSKDLTV